MKAGELRFDSLKEARGWFFVEYSPPIAGNPFALVQLTILADADASDLARISTAMEQEMELWLQRYPVPVMVSAYDNTGDLVPLKSEKASSHLMGRRLMSGQIEKQWGLFEEKSLPDLSPEELRRIYHDVSFRTAEQIRSEAQQNLKRTRRSIQLSVALLILWFVVIPVAIGILGAANPIIGFLVLAYSIWKGFVQLMKLLGKWPESARDREESEKQQRMRHYHWHCERNPEGFQQLKIENFDREKKERTAREAASLSRG